MKQKERFPGNVGSLEEEMANYSSILAWRITWAGGHGGLQSIESDKAEVT